jgi:hypothetical protein
MIPRILGSLLALAALLVPQVASSHIVFLSPNGDEVYSAGDVVHIRWCIAISHTLENWDLWYDTAQPGVTTSCVNASGDFQVIALDVAPTCTEAGGGLCFLDPDPPCCMDYFWTVPEGIDSDQVKIKVRMDNAGTDYYDVSDAPFTITPATTSPLVSGPSAFALAQNEPNPFFPDTRISFVLDPGKAAARLAVFDVRGALVRTLVDGVLSAGPHTVEWDGVDDAGAPVGSGIYFYRLEAGARVETRKMVRMR